MPGDVLAQGGVCMPGGVRARACVPGVMHVWGCACPGTGMHSGGGGMCMPGWACVSGGHACHAHPPDIQTPVKT